MEITEDYLKVQGFKNWNKDEWFKPFKEDWHISIRPTPGNDSWQVSVFKRPTEAYGKRSEDLANDNNAMSFTGCITTIEQLDLAKRACGIKDKINWRAQIPFSIKRTKRTFKLYQYFDGKDIFTGYETPDYNTAMAEMRRRNVEFNQIR